MLRKKIVSKHLVAVVVVGLTLCWGVLPTSAGLITSISYNQLVFTGEQSANAMQGAQYLAGRSLQKLAHHSNFVAGRTVIYYCKFLDLTPAKVVPHLLMIACEIKGQNAPAGDED